MISKRIESQSFDRQRLRPDPGQKQSQHYLVERDVKRQNPCSSHRDEDLRCDNANKGLDRAGPEARRGKDEIGIQLLQPAPDEDDNERKCDNNVCEHHRGQRADETEGENTK